MFDRLVQGEFLLVGAIEDHFLAGARDERAMDGSGVLLTGATRRLPPAIAVEPERGFEPLTCSLRDHSEADDDESERT